MGDMACARNMMSEVKRRYGGDLGEIWGRCGGDVACARNMMSEVKRRYGGDLREI